MLWIFIHMSRRFAIKAANFTGKHLVFWIEIHIRLQGNIKDEKVETYVHAEKFNGTVATALLGYSHVK